VGHIGSCLCVADILATLYTSGQFDFAAASHDRDRFVLGKGHAALALYATLEATGQLGDADLSSFGSDGSPFGVHPERHLPGIDFSTGSLGHGLGYAAGAALAARIQHSDRRVAALLSDAECDAGSTWEAVQFAGHHRLASLVAIIDDNGQQALGSTRDILDLEPIADRWRAATWEAREVDGHDVDALEAALTPSLAGPVVVVARTVFGAGVPFMERQLDWHYLPMNEDQYRTALSSLEQARAR
jgi:transketolase